MKVKKHGTKLFKTHKETPAMCKSEWKFYVGYLSGYKNSNILNFY